MSEERRLARVDELGNRWWWEVRRVDATVIVRHGQDGRSGELRTRTWKDAADAQAELDALVASRLDLGFVDASPPIPPPAWEQAVDDAPDDPAAWHILADALLERGDPRGEALVQALAAGAHERVEPTGTWRSGWRRTATLEDEAAITLVRDPAARFLTHLTVRARPGEQWMPDLRAALLSVRPPWPLRVLELRDDGGFGRTELGAALAPFVRLRTLRLDGPLGLGPLSMPQLETLWKSGLTASDLRAVADSALPALRRLRLESGLSSVAQLHQVTAPHPRLTHLGLRRARVPGLATALAELPHPLETLDLRACALTDADAATLGAGAFPALRRLDLRGNPALGAGLAALAARWDVRAD